MEWKKKWQMAGGTAEFSVSLDPGRIWGRQEESKEEEQLEDWEVVDTPPYEEMKRFHGTAPAKKDVLEQDHQNTETAPASSAPSIAERRRQPVPQASELRRSQGSEDETKDLHPCDSCNSYHYIEECAYRLPEDKWLEYHATHMATQALNSRAPEGTHPKKNYRMTESSQKMLADDHEYRRKTMLERGRREPKDPSAELFRERWERAEQEEEGSEDELAGPANIHGREGNFVQAVRPARAVRFVNGAEIPSLGLP
ncbi:hypothetical protein PRZ48_001927 [Zasmidium cellare]|uniref:Uncharacterized protein n=1 Tax=Zasmidium cellare TaxID=395010 RepID=A0ABR0F2M1_ZASCE|nr:hypothetical protein PRZ48_001927 [Zasmidium cellare]